MTSTGKATNETSSCTNVTDRADASEKAPLGLYVHVPFCASTCDFCAFYQVVPTRAKVELFLEGVARELKLARPDRRVSTVFWGGGTPGLLAPGDLRALGERVLATCEGRPDEWTVELAPASVTEARLEVLAELGVNRLSIGVQSFTPKLLDALGRQHTVEQVLRAFGRARAAGFDNINLDLMFALPGQDEATWLNDLRTALELKPEHLSTYCLTFEEDTKLWFKLSQGKVKPDRDREARLYERTWDELEAAGLTQYEVSNFALAGRACIHNINTWRMSEWIGVGPAAAGQHDGWRGTNPADLETWAAQVARGERMTVDRTELTPALLAEDALVFGLRMNDGVDLDRVRARPGAASLRGWDAVLATLTRLEETGLLERVGSAVRLTRRGRLVADAVGAELMGLLFNPING